MKNIYIFNEESRAAVYGIGTYIRQVVKCLRDNPEIMLNVVVLNSTYKEVTIAKMEGYTCFHIPNCDIPNITPERYFRNIWFLFMSNACISPDDNLIFHLNYTDTYPLVGLMRRYYPYCKIIFTIHYQNWCFHLNGNVSFFKQIISERESLVVGSEKKNILDGFDKEKRLYQSVDRVICLSEFTKSLLHEVYQVPDKKISLVYNGVQDEYVRLAVDEKDKLKQQYFLSEKDKIILFVGRLDEIKGLPVLIEAFKRVVDIYQNCHLVVVGTGDLLRYLEQSAPYWNKITFTGFLGKDNLHKFYQVADFGIMLSMHEQCSYVAMEMMMFGIPVINTDTTGLNEMFPPDRMKLKIHYQGYKVSISAKECSEAILHALDKAKSIQPDNRNLYFKKYTLEQMNAKLLSLYKSL